MVNACASIFSFHIPPLVNCIVSTKRLGNLLLKEFGLKNFSVIFQHMRHFLPARTLAQCQLLNN